MRYLKAYKWEDVLEERVPRTMIGLELISKEIDNENRQYQQMNRKRR